MTAIPALQMTIPEVRARRLRQDTVADAYNLFRINGCLLLENVFSPSYIKNLRAAYFTRYGCYFEDKVHDDVLAVGQKRFQITVDVTSEFNDPKLYANLLLLPIVQKCVGNDCVIGSYGSVVALAGAPQQHVHRDGALFGGLIDAMLPSFALTLMIPLVELNETNGTTRMWKGTHVTASENSENLPYHDPFAPIGSCMLMDYRLIHSGTPNQSEQVRPILYIVYNRPWFKDYRNFRKQPAIKLGWADYQKIEESERPLFAMAEVSAPDSAPNIAGISTMPSQKTGRLNEHMTHRTF
jgi:hypothetical protein